jgi:hypothetical protein
MKFGCKITSFIYMMQAFSVKKSKQKHNRLKVVTFRIGKR